MPAPDDRDPDRRDPDDRDPARRDPGSDPDPGRASADGPGGARTPAGREATSGPRREARADTSEDPAEDVDSGQRRLWRAGRTGWAVLGLAGVALLVGYLASLLALVVVPVVLALFPATLLVPVSDWMKARGLPKALASLFSILGGILLIGVVVAAMVPLVIAELPELTESAAQGVEELQQVLEDGVLGVQVGGVEELLEMGREQLGEAGDLAGQAMSAAIMAFETVAGLLLMLVALFFYLKDGRRLADGLARTAPARIRPALRESMQRGWDTLGSYFRGQLLVALADALLIGIGLLILGIPLALPLAVLIFFGGLFPIVGAVTTGALAVLVAMADQGLVIGLVVLGIVVAVQQLESNVLEPLILGRAIALHPLVVLLAITAGAVLLGVLGAFIAVPAAAITARVLDYLRGEDDAESSEDARPAGASEATGAPPAGG